MALSMEEGHIIFQFDLGFGDATMRSENKYNDGQDHRVEVARERNRGVLKVCWISCKCIDSVSILLFLAAIHLFVELS